MARILTKRISGGKGPVCGIGIYEPRVLAQSDAPYLRRVYMMWYSMLSRVHPSYASQRPSYAGTSVAPEFVHFADFAGWAVKQIGWDCPGFHLDKDILRKGNRIYSANTCVFVPAKINTLLTKASTIRGDLPIGVMHGHRDNTYEAHCRINGKRKHLGIFESPEDAFAAYKHAKESEIKRAAEFWKSQIDPRAYAALMAYQVELTD